MEAAILSEIPSIQSTIASNEFMVKVALHAFDIKIGNLKGV
jgi:hypothetical protein